MVLCSNSGSEDAAEEKRKEANQLFLESAKDLVIGSIEIVEAFVLTEINPLLGLPAAESAYEHLSNAWEEIHASAKAYEEAQRLEEEKKKDR